MTITVYTFVDEDDNEKLFHTQDYKEAKTHAQENNLLIVANEYEWADSSPVAGDDYRPQPNTPEDE